MEKPDWDLKTPSGKQAMGDWLDFMLDSGAGEIFDAEDEAYFEANMPAFQRIVSQTARISRLSEGKGTAEDQRWAIRQIEEFRQPAPKKLGRPPKDATYKGVMVMLASDEAVRIKKLWKEEYERNDAQMAIEYAVRRTVKSTEIELHCMESYRCELVDSVADNLNRTKSRKLSWEKVKTFSFFA